MNDGDPALRRIACFAPAPLPLDAVASDVEAFRSACAGRDDVVFEEHPLWRAAVTLSPSLRAALRPAADDEKQAIEGLARYFVGYFVWPPAEMRFNAEALEPHLQHVVELARRHSLHDVLCRVQHQRALFLAWGGVRFDAALELEAEAFDSVMRTTSDPGTVLAILTTLAYFEERTGQLAAACRHVDEAAELVATVATKPSIEPFIVHCQQAQLYRRADDVARASEAETRARTILAKLEGSEKLERHLSTTMPLGLWFLQRFIGL